MTTWNEVTHEDYATYTFLVEMCERHGLLESRDITEFKGDMWLRLVYAMDQFI